MGMSYPLHSQNFNELIRDQISNALLSKIFHDHKAEEVTSSPMNDFLREIIVQMERKNWELPRSKCILATNVKQGCAVHNIMCSAFQKEVADSCFGSPITARAFPCEKSKQLCIKPSISYLEYNRSRIISPSFSQAGLVKHQKAVPETIGT